MPDATVEAGLRAAFLSDKGFASAEVSALPHPGSVLYAYAPASHTYWAVAAFDPTEATTPQHAVDMQDGANDGIFTRSSSGGWRMDAATTGIPFPCPGVLPPDVEAALGLVDLSGCAGAAPVPVGGPLDLVLGSDHYLYPAAWLVTPLANFGGPASFGSVSDPTSGALIDYEINGGSAGDGGFYNADGSPNLDGSARQLPRCTVTSWTAIDATHLGFTCQPTAAGLIVRGIVWVHAAYQGAEMLTVTLPARDQAVTDAIVSFFRSRL